MHQVLQLFCAVVMTSESLLAKFNYFLAVHGRFFLKLITQQKNKHSFFSSYCSFFLEMYTEIPASFLTNTTEAQTSKQKNNWYSKKDYIKDYIWNIKGLFYTYVISFWSILVFVFSFQLCISTGFQLTSNSKVWSKVFVFQTIESFTTSIVNYS